MIYYDNASTTHPITVQSEVCANPSSPHEGGILAERKLGSARTQLYNCLNEVNKNAPQNIVFTSGGTESNNLALLGFAFANRRKDILFLTEPWEHPSILEPLKFIKKQGLGRVTIAPHSKWESVLPHGGTCLAAISHVNSETGDINDMSAIASKLKSENPNTVVLVDGAQGCFKEFADLTNVDMYSFSAHKFHGYTGVGALAIRPSIRLAPIMYGGGQENRLRPGTENLHGILHMADAASYSASREKQIIIDINKTISQLAQELPEVFINGQQNASPYILNMSFAGVKGEPLVHLLSQKGVYASMGAACRSRSNKKTVLEDMGFDKHIAECAVRFSFSHFNTLEEAQIAKKIIADCVTYLRTALQYKG